jgi:hypothetical protein
MIKALRVIVIIFGIGLVASGVLTAIFPQQSLDLTGLEGLTDTVRLWMGVAGAAWVAIGAWGIIAAAGNLLKNLVIVKVMITKGLLATIVMLIVMLQDYVSFSDVAVMLVPDAVFAILLLICYPWRPQSN